MIETITGAVTVGGVVYPVEIQVTLPDATAREVPWILSEAARR